MSRIRTIKPEFWTDEKTGTLTEYSKCLFLGLLNYSDDFGVLKFNPAEWRVRIFPYHYDTTPGDVSSSVIGEILPKGLLSFFGIPPEWGEPAIYCHITNFLRHQVVNKPSLPLLPGWEKSDNPKTYAENKGFDYREIFGDEIKGSGRAPAPLLPGREGKGREGKGTTTKQRTTKTLAAPVGTAVVTPDEIPIHLEPRANAPAFTWLSYNFYLARKKVGDDYFDPYDDKHLAICKNIVEKNARGNYEEARKRAINLVLWNRVDPNYYKITPQDLIGKWTPLSDPPQAAPGMKGLKGEVFQSEMEKIRSELSGGETS